MKRGTIWIALTCLMAASLVLASCNTATQTATSTQTQTTISNTTKTVSSPTSTVSTSVSTVKTTPATKGNWWDSLGIPQYGDGITLRMARNITNFDPWNASPIPTLDSGWMEKLITDVWTMDPAIFDYRVRPATINNMTGQLADSWDFPDPSTIVFHLHKGVHWQDIPPVSGREFVADDVVYHYQRLYGLGSSFSPSPFQAPGSPCGTNLISVTAPDKYTVVFKWKVSNAEYIIEALQSYSTGQDIASPEAVKQWGNLNDWHHAIGTGPFILKDFVDGSSATMVRNPNYWGYDERYPQNKLPYVDTLKVLIVPDDATALAAMRTGKIDALDSISIQNSQTFLKTNPEIKQTTLPATANDTVDPRNDVKPFSDIRVRIAMQKAIDLPTIASTYYNGIVDPIPSGLASNSMTGWGYPYQEWPQALKDEYAYDVTASKKLLAEAGYPTGFKTNVVASTAIDMNLLQVVKAYWLAVGIDLEIRPMDQASWTVYTINSKKHDQMMIGGAASLGRVSEPLRSVGAFWSGNSMDYYMVNDPAYDALYNKTVNAASIDETKKYFRDACEYVARNHFTICLLVAKTYAFYQPWLKGYYGQYDSVGGGVGAHQLGFFNARFWIDHSAKKASGH